MDTKTKFTKVLNEIVAGACVQKICEELLSEGKGLCLFYDNPKAGSVYRKLGFKEIGQWSSVFF